MTVLIPQILEYSPRPNYVQPYPSLIYSLGNVRVKFKSGSELFVEGVNSATVNKNTYTIVKESSVYSVPVDSVLAVELAAYCGVKLSVEDYVKYPYPIS